MGDDSLILREDGYIRMNFPVTSLTYHSNLNIILVKTDVGGVHVLDVNSGVILQSSCLSADDGGTLGVEYAPAADRVFVWDSSGVSSRSDYNGVLLLHTALQRPLPSSQLDKIIRIELVLSEAVLLYQCLQSLDAHSIEGLSDFVNELKNSIDAEPVRKGVKAQKWSTVTICLPQSTIRLVTIGVVQELKGQNRRIPALSIASAVGQRANDLVSCSRDEETRPLMYSEAERKETFKRWPHMDYKWALPARMAQAGFYHQPSPSGDDRAMCFTCLVCLVCWEKSDEPWVEHERHSPNCPFVRGEYTHNVPMSVTNATACAVPCPNVSVVSKGNTGDLIATGTTEGKINIWKFDSGLKLVKFIHLSPYDSIFSGVLLADCNKVWSASLEKDSSTYGIELTAMAFIGMTNKQEAYPQANTDSTDRETSTSKAKPSLICAVTITRTNSTPTDQPIKEDSSKALFDSGLDKSKETVQAMNDQNEAKSNFTSTNKMLFLLTYDIHNSSAGSITTVIHTSNSSGNSKPGGSKKVCTVARTDDANIYDEIYFQYSDDDTELPPCTGSLIDEQISNVINLNASSSKEDCKIWEPKKIIFTKHFKVLTPPPPTVLLPELPESGQGSMLDFVGKISQLKSWKSANLESVGTKLADQTDAVLQQADPITHYLNMNGPLEISDLKWYDGGEGTEKVKVFGKDSPFGVGKVGTQTAISNSNNNDGFDSDPPQEEVVSQGIAVQCLLLPVRLNLREDSKVTHLLPTEDKEHLLIVISCVEPEKVKVEDEVDGDGDVKMDVDDVVDASDKMDKCEAKAYFLLYKIKKSTSIYTLDDYPVTMKELPFNESPVDLCLLPIDKHEQYSFAAVGVDGSLRLYSLPEFKILSEKRVPKGQFTSVVYCASVERLSVSTKHGMIYFYALNNAKKDSAGDTDDDEFANIDFDMLQKAPRDEVCGPTSAPVILANKTELDLADLEALISLTGFYGTNTTVPYSAVVPGFWCELSPAQRSRSDHQNNRTWRLQNTSSTWDEHVLELTLPYSVSLAHVEFGFTLHTTCPVNLPTIQVTLLKQNLHGIGYKKDASFGHRSESPQHFPVIDAEMPSLENPVNSEEYLRAHNAEILAGPLLLSSGLDMSQQSGTLILTSPKLYRARGRSFLVHIKTLYDPAKDMNKTSTKSTESNSKKSTFIGCDWLHQISLTVRSSPHTDVPMERQQRIAMLESNSFLTTLLGIVVNKGDSDKKKIALDLLIWVISIRLQRMRLAKTEKEKDNETYNFVETQQLECVRIVEEHVDALIKNCILCANRSIAKKCVKIILITSEGVKHLPWKSTFDETVSSGVCACIPYVGACSSAGALRWLMALAQAGGPPAAAPAPAPALLQRCLALLHATATCLAARADPYHHLLRARFGLYGLPLEQTIFASEVPELGRGSSSPVTYASVLAGDTSAPPPPKPDYQLKDLLNLPPDMDTKSPVAAWWAQNDGVGVFGAGLSEAQPLHVSCHVASDGTKLESSGARLHAAVVSSLPPGPPAHPHQLWSAMKEGNKQTSQDPDSLEDVESSPMDCDPQDKLEFSEDKLFKEQEQCGIGWAALVTRPPQHTLVVERMHSGARRYIVLDFGHTVRLTDLIIPSCSDLVTLCIDIWVTSEETDCVKLAFATDIATKHLVLTDIQPPPLCRYMKITTIGRYGMSAMKCKIPLGWFYGEIADITNVQASVNALNALYQDLTCRFRLATGKLMDLLNPYLQMYNGNAAHMMAYLNLANDTDPKVITAYQECIELQQQMHTCNNILRRLQNTSECNDQLLDMINKGKVTSEALLERASTDKLRVISENVVDLLLYFFYQVGDVACPEVGAEWCARVSSAVRWWGARAAAALATLLARLCGAAGWWGDHLADTLTDAFAAADAPPLALDRCLVLVMYMCRKSLYSHRSPESGVAAALSARALSLLRAPHPQPALTAAVLTALAAVLDTVAANRHARWDWVTGGRAGSGGEAAATSSPRTAECQLHHRKLHKKLLHQMHEVEPKRGKQAAHDDRGVYVVPTRAGAGGGGGGRRGARGGRAGDGLSEALARVLPPPLAAALAAALVSHMLAADSSADGDVLLLCAKVVGRLCALCGGAALLEPASILGLARLAVSLPPWPRHALTTLLQDLVEYESSESNTSPSEEWCGGEAGAAGAGGAGGVRVRITRSFAGPGFGKAPRRVKGASVADVLADSFGLAKSSNFSKPKIIPQGLTNIMKDVVDQLNAESEDSESEEKLEQYIFVPFKKESKSKTLIDNSNSVVSSCTDARLDSGAGGCGGGAGGAGEALARRALLATGGALAHALRSPHSPPATPSPPGTHEAGSPAAAPAAPPSRAHPPLTHTLYDVFRHLALEFHYQMDCTFMENVVSLWLTLNGSSWGNGAWSQAALALPADTPRIRLASDTVNALLHSLCTLENISLRCWVLSMQALAWIASLPLQTEGSTQTMGRVILECEHFVPALVRFVTMNVNTDGAVATSEPYLGGVSIGAGAGAAAALHSVVSRVVCARGAAGALAALRVVCGAWRRDADAPAAPPTLAAPDLHATLLRLAHPLLQLLPARHHHHAHHALALFDTVAHVSSWWVRESCGRGVEGGAEARLSGLLADVLGGGGAGACRRAPLRRSVLAQLLHYCHRLLSVPLAPHAQQQPRSTAASTSNMAAGGSSPAASGSEAGSSSQTDESKAQHSAAPEATNVEDERKQQQARAPCVADTVLQHPLIMQKFYRTLSMCDGMNTLLLNTGMNTETSSEHTSLKEELFLLVAHMPNVASNPALMVNSLMEFLRKEEIVNLSQAMQQLLIRLLDKPEALAAFIDAGGLELAVEKLTACHQAGPSGSQGLVSSLMNYLKLPPQLINLSTPASGSKKNQPPVIETASGGLVNIAPLCSVSCGNPTAQAADVLLDGGAGAGGGARRRAPAGAAPGFSADDASLALTLALPYAALRAAAWSYHFFSADDASLALTLALPYAARLHELHLQPHLTSLATCPGAVAVEAGCGGTLAPLGPPQNTAGMTFIRLAVMRPVVCTTVQLRLYKPRDSSNMGLLQLKLLVEPAFNKHVSNSGNTNNWAWVVAAAARARLPAARWWGALDAGGGGAANALCACVAAGGAAGAHAHAALLAAARACPARAPPLLDALLHMDAQAHAHAFQASSGLGGSRVNGSMNAVCELVRQLCRWCPEGAAAAYVRWLAAAAERWLRDRKPPAAALTHTLAAVLWNLKEERLLENLEQLITDDLFELVYTWVQDVPENSLLKEALDAVLCSMCYIRPELFRMLLEHMDIPMDHDESMEGLTDDTKVHVTPAGVGAGGAAGAGGAGGAGGGTDGSVAWRLRGWQLQTVAAAAMSPAATTALLHSRLPAAVVAALTDFSEAKLEVIKEQLGSKDIHMEDSDKETSQPRPEANRMRRACRLVEWARRLCAERRLKDWLGDWLGAPGATFWRPLLRLLCYPRPPHSTWQEGAQYAQLEENTIRLFAELTVCHAANQKLFASTLHNILESLHCVGPEGISGFTRALILRLVLSAERVWVALRWAARGGAAPAVAPGHPARHHHALLALPLHTTLRDLLRDHRPPMPVVEETVITSSSGGGAGSVLRSSSDTAIMTAAEAWELTLAAASASKDKRVKDVKNTSLKHHTNKKRQVKPPNDASVLTVADDLIETTILVQVAGLDGFVPASCTLAQLAAAAPHNTGPHLTLTLHLNTDGDVWSGPTWDGGGAAPLVSSGSSAILREFGACGGLALVAARLPRPHAPPPPPPALHHHHHHHDLDWVKLDDPYEEVVELGGGGGGAGGAGAEEGACAGVPAHALVALGLLLKLPGYAHALLDEGARATHLLRLLLGVTHDEDGRSIVVGGGGGGAAQWSLGTLPFRVVSRLLEAAPGGAAGAAGGAEGRELRRALLALGAVRLVLACLAVFTHHRPQSAENSQASNGSSVSKSEEKSQLYWAKGTGFGTGSTQQSWNVEQALVRQRTEEEHVTVLLQVLASYMNPGEKWPPEESSQEGEASTSTAESSGSSAAAGTGSTAVADGVEEADVEVEDSEARDVPSEFIDLIVSSSLVPAICSYLRNDSVLDMSRHIPLYVCVLRTARALASLRARRLAPALRPLPRLLHQMSRTTNSYATKLRMSKKNIFGKMTYSQRFSTSSNSELSEEDEGLASLIADIQATCALMCRSEGEPEGGSAARAAGGGREARYIDLMRTMQFETFEMLAECAESSSGFRFTVPYHFEGAVRAAGERAHPARMKRLAQEAATLATSLPLSYSSSVFVRTDTDRLDVMKVLITGPSDTPYANGCFILDVYFPAEYPAVPMLINLETTGRHSVRFNPNLYNDGKVCLSVLNTWHGRPEEKWNAHTSSFLQVLVSIQSLILVPEPYFNEPGYERSRGTRVGNSASLEYNSNIYQACVRWAMLDHLRSPEPCFKEVIQTHFWIKRNEIMQTVANWITELEGQSGDERTQRTIQLNLMALKRHYVKLQEELAKLPVPAGLEELDEPFQLPAAPAAASPPPPPPAPIVPPTNDEIDHDMEKIVSQVID
ncbi:baculoviral IAP repeat-containing protein 6 [Achroia grisella]|uniref:baculoviral IAP repeat-containing protein 6 n=1 Tax=Achroia grisella TaxID=688607 RepID=UPI0027D2D10B|nr:baculoviral IAP repeat-containing protein 6 [Achroia grisella]